MWGPCGAHPCVDVCWAYLRPGLDGVVGPANQLQVVGPRPIRQPHLPGHRCRRVRPAPFDCPDTEAPSVYAIANAPFRSVKFAQRLAGFVNFVRPVAKLPLQIVIAVLSRDPKLTALVRNGHIDHPWQLSAEEYRARFHRHDAWLASESTPNDLGLADPSGTLYIPQPVHFILFSARGTSVRLLGLTGSGLKAGTGTHRDDAKPTEEACGKITIYTDNYIHRRFCSYANGLISAYALITPSIPMGSVGSVVSSMTSLGC